MATTQRNISLDVLRCLACLGVVVSHTMMPAPPQYGFLYTGASVFCGIGLGIFFFISGYLLLPVKIETATFLKHRFTRVLWPAMTWAVVYYLVKTIVDGRQMHWYDPIGLLLHGSSPVMWFIFTILGLYLISPIISPWMLAASRREASLYLVISLVIYSFCVFYGLGVVSSNSGMFYYFNNYAPYFFFGWYVKRFGWPLRMRWYALAAFTSLALMAVCSVWDLVVDFYKMFWVESIFSFVIVAFVSRLVMQRESALRGMGSRPRTVVSSISNLTLGVYLVHFILARRIIWNLDFVRDITFYPLQCLVAVGLTLAVSLLVCWLIALTPLGKYVVGCSLGRKP